VETPNKQTKTLHQLEEEDDDRRRFEYKRGSDSGGVTLDRLKKKGHVWLSSSSSSSSSSSLCRYSFLREDLSDQIKEIYISFVSSSS